MGRPDGLLRSVIVSADGSVATRLVAVMADHGPANHTTDPGRITGRDNPDVVIWDVDGPAIDSLPPELPVLAVGPNSAEVMMRAIEAGAQGYLELDADDSEIANAAFLVAGGTAVVSPLLLGPLLRAVVERRRQERSQRAALEVLTPREREVFDLAARGLSRAEVAEVLVISPDTARTHLQKVMGKLDIHSQAELVAFAASCGIETSIEGGMP